MITPQNLSGSIRYYSKTCQLKHATWCKTDQENKATPLFLTGVAFFHVNFYQKQVRLENTHDWSIHKPLKANIEKSVNCMIDCVHDNNFFKVVFQTMKCCFKSFPQSCFSFWLQLCFIGTFLGPVNLFYGYDQI